MDKINPPVTQEIYALAKPESGITVLNLNNECNLFGRKTYFCMSARETFPRIQDEPVRKEDKEIVKELQNGNQSNFGADNTNQ